MSQISTASIKRFFIFFIPIFLLISFAAWAFFYSHLNSEEAVKKTQELALARERRSIFLEKLREAVSDLFVLALNHEISEMVDAWPNFDAKNVKNDFLLFSKTKKVYEQIRVLDRGGMEVVRVDYNNGNPQVVPDHELQFKGDMYYFNGSINLNKGGVYFSPLDLNVEHGRVERPLKPTIRIGTPIFNETGEKQGVVLLNYRVKPLLDNFREYNVNYSGKVMIVNSDGYWIIGPSSEDEWGFIFREKEDRTISQKFPNFWKEASALDEGQFWDGEGLITFTNLSPPLGSFELEGKSVSGNIQGKGENRGASFYLKALSFMPEKDVMADTLDFLNVLSYFYFFLIAVSILGAVGLTRAQMGRERARIMADKYLAAVSGLKNEMAEQLTIAESVQREFLPSRADLEKFDNCEISFYYLAAGSLGGDLFDVIPYGESKTAFVLADVSGHGPAAALIMAMTKGLINSEAEDRPPPAELAHRLNKKLLEMTPENYFITLFFAVVDFKERKISYVTAGHPSPVIVGPERGEPFVLKNTGTLIGAFDIGKGQFMEEYASFSKGDKIVFFSDGIYETNDSNGNHYGLDRLLGIISSHSSCKPELIIEKVMEDVESFWDARKEMDDIALVAVELT